MLNVISSPQGGGAELLVAELTKRLPKYGVDSYAIYFDAPSGFALTEREFSLGVSARNARSVLLLRAKIKQFCTDDAYVVVHAHLTWPFYYAALACVGLPVMLVYTEHSTTNKRRDIPCFKYLERFVYSRYDRVVCISNGVKASLSKWLSAGGMRSVQTINNGGRTFALCHRPNVAGPIKLVSVGSLNFRKGFDVAIKAVALLPRGTVREYIIIGEGPERPRLTDLINRLGLADIVRVLGWRDELEEYFHNADIQLIPSVWEGFGLVAVEGMSTGLPVIASDVDGLIEVLSPESNFAALLVSDHRVPERWAEKIASVTGKLKVDRLKLSRASSTQAKKFTLDKMVERYAELYRSLYLRPTPPILMDS
ncbi:glycosyltransferase family 4 protein [Pseudomonas profundi]|uniref:glycosyltransferase family 4 protein n=1 Tax=Pseudomonas profundi TaxID=1981513 RepID=UPI001CC244D8|nr:glycosyltransferase family 4 protein [Pseudomonas profundi]